MENKGKINLIELDKIKQLLLIAEQDLESSEILNNHKKYSNSIWSFSQSVEKTTKCAALMDGSIKFDELKEKMNHFPLKKNRLDILNNLKEAQELEDSIKQNPELKKLPFIKNLDLDHFKENGRFAEKMISDVLKKEKIFSEDIIELEGAINEMYELLKKIKKLNMEKINKIQIKEYRKAWIENIQIYIKLCEKQRKPISETEKEEVSHISDETLQKIVDNTRKNILLGGIIHALNTILNILINPHFNFLRYPELKNPLEYYTQQNPLVIKLNELINIQKENLLLHGEVLEILERNYSRIKIEKES